MKFSIFQNIKLEFLLGLYGVVLGNFLILFAAFLTPGYNPIQNTIFAIREGPVSTLFNIGYVTLGCLSLPFYMYLERVVIVGVNEMIKRLAGGVAIFTSLCLAYNGISGNYQDSFMAFQVFVSITALIGPTIFITLFSYIWFHDRHSIFYRFHIYLGFIITGYTIIFILFLQPLLEWTLFFLQALWTILTVQRLLTANVSNSLSLYRSVDKEYRKKSKKSQGTEDTQIKINTVMDKTHEILKEKKETTPFLEKFTEKGILNQIFLFIGIMGTQLSFINIIFGILFDSVLLLIFIAIRMFIGKKKKS